MRRIKLGLHNHTQMSDSEYTVSGLLKALDEAGYDAVAITDHNTVTVPHPLQLQDVDLLLFKGIELTFPGIHIVCLEPFDTGTVVNCLTSSRIRWLAHPKYQFPDVVEMMKAVERFHLDGVEIYNSGELQIPKMVIDKLKCTLYAADDVHIPQQIMSSWMEMDVDEVGKDIIIEKLLAGDFDYYNDPSKIPSWW